MVDGGESDDHQFIASFIIEKFQKHLRTTRELIHEFVARGRIWRPFFNVGPKGTWVASCGLSTPSLLASARSSLQLETRTKKGEPGRETPLKKPHEDKGTEFMEIRALKGMMGNVDGKSSKLIYRELSDQWVTYNNPKDVACDDTLHAMLKITLENPSLVMTGSP